MIAYLDMERFPAFLERHFGTDAQRSSRIVGVDRTFESWYIDIARFFGTNGIDPVEISVAYSDGMFQLSDPLIREFAAFVESELRAQGRLYDGPSAMRLVDFNFHRSNPILMVQEARYADQCANFAMDLSHPPLFAQWGGSLRDYLYATIPSHAPEDNPLCLCFGVCGLLLVEDGNQRYILQVMRSSRLASLENSIGPSVAGSVDFDTTSRSIAELIINSLAKEVTEELGLNDGEFSITPLAYAREIFRGERPQLFAVVTTPLDRKEIARRLDSLPECDREFSTYDFLPLTNMRLSSDLVASMNFEAKMAYYLLEEWLSK